MIFAGATVLVTFDSIHDVMAAEHELRAAGLPCDLTPTPRALSADCGMAVECEEAGLARLQALRAAGRLPWRAAFREEGGRWVEVAGPR